MARYQRQEATYLMRAVNKAYKIPNPPSWNKKTRKKVGKAAEWFLQTFLPSKKGPVRVS